MNIIQRPIYYSVHCLNWLFGNMGLSLTGTVLRVLHSMTPIFLYLILVYHYIKSNKICAQLFRSTMDAPTQNKKALKVDIIMPLSSIVLLCHNNTSFKHIVTPCLCLACIVDRLSFVDPHLKRSILCFSRQIH